MKNVIIPMDFSSSSTRVILYALGLMREEECTFFMLNLPEAAAYSSTKFEDKEWINCIQNEAVQRLQKLQREITKVYPSKKIKIQLLFPGKVLEEQVDPDSLIIGSTAVLKKTLQLPYDFFRNLKSPLLFIPKEQKFSLPKKILITLEPHVEIRQATLTPFKKLFGNHDLNVEIIKMYSGKIDHSLVARDEYELNQLFEVYHPKVGTLITGHVASYLGRTMQKDNYDLHIVPLSQSIFPAGPTTSQITNAIADSKIPVMILQGTPQEQQIPLRSPGRTRNKTAIVQ
ncbi:adenine nucleotide alpha hydrolase family protein [Salinimicrobium sediminilitoris]|uniref:hypothetical protein n=1 Tax=Salinimicrobium sediminilitoris TaxID=2876715 RepID=UPI001E32D45B|nr:hypothetical protein [Salinimicrobium sediminilitoris]MCC8358990.1 hypothetical protein [Salinimicrobium sediminilitoris]